MKAPSIAPSITTCATWTPFGPSSRARLCASARKPVLGAGESGKARAAAQARGRAGEQDRPAPARRHDPRRLAAGQKAGETGHLPHFGIDLRGRLDDGKAHVRADIEDEDLQRADLRSIRSTRAATSASTARVQTKSERLAALRADRSRQRLERLEMARAARHADGRPSRAKGPRDRCAKPVARADDEADSQRSPLLRHAAPLRSRSDGHAAGARSPNAGASATRY